MKKVGPGRAGHLGEELMCGPRSDRFMADRRQGISPRLGCDLIPSFQVGTPV